MAKKRPIASGVSRGVDSVAEPPIVGVTPGEPEGAPNPSTLRASRRAAGLVTVQILAILASIVLYAVETAMGKTDDTTRAVMSMVVMAVFAGGLALLARGLWRASSWAATPTIVWNALLLPVAIEFLRGGQFAAGLPILLIAGAAIAFVIMAVRARPGGFGAR